MKVTIEVDCSPEEARKFFGLPDVERMQKKIMDEVERRTLAEMDRVSPESLLNKWFSMSSTNPAQMQEAFGRIVQSSFSLGNEFFRNHSTND